MYFWSIVIRSSHRKLVEVELVLVINSINVGWNEAEKFPPFNDYGTKISIKVSHYIVQSKTHTRKQYKTIIIPIPI